MAALPHTPVLGSGPLPSVQTSEPALRRPPSSTRTASSPTRRPSPTARAADSTERPSNGTGSATRQETSSPTTSAGEDSPSRPRSGSASSDGTTATSSPSGSCSPRSGEGSRSGSSGEPSAPDSSEPKYLGLPGRKPLLGWESALGSPEVYLVEGVFDLLTLWSWHLPAVALVGTHVRAPVLDAFARFERVYLVLDNDCGGTGSLGQAPEGDRPEGEGGQAARGQGRRRAGPEARWTLGSSQGSRRVGAGPTRPELSLRTHPTLPPRRRTDRSVEVIR